MFNNFHNDRFMYQLVIETVFIYQGILRYYTSILKLVHVIVQFLEECSVSGIHFYN